MVSETSPASQTSHASPSTANGSTAHESIAKSGLFDNSVLSLVEAAEAKAAASSRIIPPPVSVRAKAVPAYPDPIDLREFLSLHRACSLLTFDFFEDVLGLLEAEHLFKSLVADYSVSRHLKVVPLADFTLISTPSSFSSIGIVISHPLTALSMLTSFSLVVHTVDWVRASSTVLFTSILCVSAKFFRPDLYQPLLSHAQQLIARGIADSLAQLGLVQALCLLIYWKVRRDCFPSLLAPRFGNSRLASLRAGAG